MAAPVGPTGCNGPDHDQGAWLVGAGYGYFDADLRFEGKLDAELRQHAVTAWFGRRFANGFSLRLAGGGVLDGELEAEGTRFDVEPGWVANVVAARQWLGEPGRVPFLVTTLAYSMSRSRTVDADGNDDALTASDLRLGALFGYAPWKEWSPYLAARLFGGPVGWRDQVGSDRHHYAVGVGSGISIDPVELSLEGSFLGERSAAIGVTLAIE